VENKGDIIMSDKLSEIKNSILSLSYSEMMDLSEDIDIIATVSNDEAYEILNSVFHVQPIIAKNLFKWAKGEFDLQSSQQPDSPRKQQSVAMCSDGSMSLGGKEIILFEQIKPVFGIPFSMQKLKQMANSAEFPAPVRIDSRRIAWMKNEIDAWVSTRPLVKK
jgi:hypothetical protein